MLDADTCVHSPGERRVDTVKTGHHHQQLQVWAENCPDNFENRAALVGAEIARLEGRELDAERLYERAIRSARENGFVNNEAIAFELASAFYRARGLDRFAELYLRNAHSAYRRWGAEGKVRQLEELVSVHEGGGASTFSDQYHRGANWSPRHRDRDQALASGVKRDRARKLLKTIMRTAIEQAGAERGLLIFSRGAEPRIVALPTTGADAVIVELCDEPVTAAMLPELVVHHVVRTSESVILDNAAAQPQFAADPFIIQRRARSILCLPLINKGVLTGILYLENNLTARVFAPSRIAVLRLLTSQAAIALENTDLYRDLAEREAKIRRLVDGNIIGVFFWEIGGRVLEANDEFLEHSGLRP